MSSVISSCKHRSMRRVWLVAALAILAIAFAATAVWGATDGFANAIGKKNAQACDGCIAVRDGQPPSLDDEPYTKLLDGSVYRGGHAISGLQGSTAAWDKGPNDFAKVLPYGNTYIDASKLNWNKGSNYIIDIPEGSPFKWIASTDNARTDSTGTTTTDSDPLGDGRGLAAGTTPIIAYVGPLTGYLDITEEGAAPDPKYYLKPSTAKGFTNTFEAAKGSYLYRITYPGAATLKDGTKGNLVITTTKVQIETTLTSANALIRIQGPNNMSLSAAAKDDSGNFINQQEYVVKTAAEVATAMQSLTQAEQWDAASNTDKLTRGGTGVIVDLDFMVTDAAGNPVKGAISYAACDMDFENFQDLWGRSVTGNDKHMFNEALTLVDGALSYAVTPEYDHANGTTVDVIAGDTTSVPGWIPVGVGDSQLDSPLIITKTGNDTKANGVRFSASPMRVIRDKNGTFDKALFNTSNAMVTSLGTSIQSASKFNYQDLGKNAVPNYIKKQLDNQDVDGDGTPDSWNSEAMTNENVLTYLGAGSYATQRNDSGATNPAGQSYDTGFAVLLDASGSKLRWSASNQNGGTAGTDLFDTTIFTYVEMSHGTGGGIYFETYDLASGCVIDRAEGTATMSRGTDATVTVVPEDGYRVKTVQVVTEGPEAQPITYAIDELEFNEGIYVDVANKVTIQDNGDGTYDVTLVDMGVPRHVHVDFTADYYFYKVWQVPEGESVTLPDSLELAATPFAFVFSDVTIDGVAYTINGNTFTDPEGTEYVLKNNALTIGQGASTKVYYLQGNTLVLYDRSDPDNPKVVEECEINLEYVQAGDPVSFAVAKADADSGDEPHVLKEVDGDNTIWKIRYPADGYETLNGESWAPLPIETEPASHAINHVERLYWFVTETVPEGWRESYDNSTAEAPGKVAAAQSRSEVYQIADEGELTAWAASSIKDYEQAEATIEDAADNDHAYMSVFSSHADAITKHDSRGGEIINELVPPEGIDDETYGAKGQPQTGTPAFEAGSSEVETVQLIDPYTGNPTDEATVDALDEDGNKIGTYTLNEGGTVTFTPNPDFEGDPQPAKLLATDKNGLTAEAQYQPHVVSTEKTVKRTITYEYENGEPVLDKDGKPLTVVQETTFVGEVDPKTGIVKWNGVLDPKTGEVTPMDDPLTTFPQVDSPIIDGYNADRPSVDQVMVTPKDKDLYEKVIYSPKGIKASPDETYGLVNQPQIGTPTFEMETTELPDGSPNKLTVKLVDPKTGKATDSKTVDALDANGNTVGTYTLNDNGTVTFVPAEDYVGNPMPLTLEATDLLGQTARTTYTPHVVDPTDEDTATRTIHFTYLTEDGEEVASDIVQTVKLVRHAKSIDPKTGKVLEWSSWDPATFPAVANPDDKAGRGWGTEDLAGELTITEPGDQGTVNVVYHKLAKYSITYDPNGGAGEMATDEFFAGDDSMSTKANTFTRDGHTFKGFLAYMTNPETGVEEPIVDTDGNPIVFTSPADMAAYFEGMPDGASIRMEAQWEPNPAPSPSPSPSPSPAPDSHWVTYIDPDGTIYMDKTSFTDEDGEPAGPADPAKDGFTFAGWDRSVDADGNITYIAKWNPVASADKRPVKSVDSGSKGYISRDHVVTYTITQEVSADATKLAINDNLEPVLEFVSAPEQVKVTCNGSKVDAQVTIADNKLSVTVADASALRGKSVAVEFQAKVRSDADLKPYLNAAGNIASIPNIAISVFNDSPKRTLKSDEKRITVSVGKVKAPAQSAKTGDSLPPVLPVALAGIALVGAGAALLASHRRRAAASVCVPRRSVERPSARGRYAR